MARKLQVVIVGDASQLERALGRAAHSATGFGSSLARAGRVAAFAAGGAALGGLAVTLRAGAREWAQSAKVAAQTEAVLKSTGGVANVTAKQVDQLGLAIMRKSGIDDEAIKTGENMLLTFSSIRNEVGKGNDIFNRTTMAVTDMDVAMTHGHSTQESLAKTAILVGKALNDPVKGATALRRVGVQLTEAQTKQIAAFVKSGDTMKAQKVILGELTKEFGGSARAMGDTLPGQISKLKESFNNLAGELFKNLVPALQRVVDWTNAHWTQIEATFRAVFTGIGWAFTNILEPTIKALIAAGEVAVAWVRANWPQISAITMRVFNDVKAVVMTVVGVIEAIWSRFGDTIMRQLQATWDFIKGYVQGAMNVIKGIINIIGGLIHGDWSRVWQGIKQIFSGIWQAIGAEVKFVLASIGNTIRGALDSFKATFSIAWSAIKAVVSTAFDGIKAILSGFKNQVIDPVVRAFQSMWSAVKTGWHAFTNAMKIAAFDVVLAIIEPFSHLPKQAGEWARKLKDRLHLELDIMRTEVAGPAGAVGAAMGQAIAAGIGASTGAIATATSRAVRAGLDAGYKSVGSTGAEYAHRTIGYPTAQGVISGWSSGIMGWASTVAAHVRAAIGAGAAQARSSVLAAFKDLASQALAAFDAKMAAWTPPALKLLGKMQIEDQINSAKQAVTDAQNQLSTAMTAANSTYQAYISATPNEGESASDFDARKADLKKQWDEAIAQVATSQKALGDAQRAQVELNLQLEADQQQKAHDARAARDREHLSQELAQRWKFLLQHPEQYRRASEMVMAVLRKYNVPMYEQGKKWASQFTDGLSAGIKALSAALKEFADHLPHSPAKKGPLAFDMAAHAERWASGLGDGLSRGFAGSLALAGDIRFGAQTGGSASRMTVGRGGGGGVYIDKIEVRAETGDPARLAQEIAEPIRRELLRMAGRNVSLGLT